MDCWQPPLRSPYATLGAAAGLYFPGLTHNDHLAETVRLGAEAVNGTGPTGVFNAAISDDGHFVAYDTTLAGVSQILLAATGF